ncbi:MAG TPA: N-acetyltransferase [Pyrinomonadaceae bacterium]|nr:N-acetyltransferase [Pyrinomonadaceae bacterium]
MIEIRREREQDFVEVYRVNSLAFEQEDEAKLVEKLRKNPHISLVAEADGKIVGHIFFSPMTLGNETTDFIALGPMAVSPEFQNQGIGSKLVREGLKVCAHEGFTAVFVLGHPNFYPRFGFETAKSKGFMCEWDVPEEVFMVRELKKGALKDKKGLVKYQPEFGEL